MKITTGLLVLLAGCVAAQADEGFLPPWEELKALYRQSIEQEFAQKAALQQEEKQVHSIDAVQYVISVSESGASGEVALSGRLLSGTPAPIPLFGKEIAISQIQEMEGGALLYVPELEHIALLPDADATMFRVVFSFLPGRKQESGMQVIRFSIPPATQNSLRLVPAAGTYFAEVPGIADTEGVYHFPAFPELCVKYVDEGKAFAAPPAVIELDAVSRIRIEKNRLLVSTCFQPMRPAPELLVLYIPPEAQFSASSLNTLHINKTAADQYAITFPGQEQVPFFIDFVLDGPGNNGEASFTLPFIEGNTGLEGRFAVEEPEDGQVIVEAEGLSSGIPVAKLGEALGGMVPRNLFYQKVAPGITVRLSYTPFQTVSTPSTVIATQELFVSYAENGSALSVLRMEVPVEMGTRMRIHAVSDAEIWSLTVNGVKQSVYTDEQQKWIVPLDGTQPSRVELAFLRQGQKVTLQGALEVIMPETGLPSRELFIGIALPARVDMLSLEGPVNAMTGAPESPPREFIGKPHFFQCSFYKGEGMTLSAMYKEPINQNQ